MADDLGCCCFIPEAPPPPEGTVPVQAVAVEQTIPLPSGTLSFPEVEVLLNLLPIDTPFIGTDDYFPVRDSARTYLGCLEVSQDIT
jgi:DUF438 domain-containing protein